MAKDIHEALDRLARFEPVDLPVLSLYLNTQANEAGKTRFEPFVRKELPARAKTYAARSAERMSFDRDVERIGEALRTLEPSANGAAIFACAGKDDFFEMLLLEAPIEDNQLFVGGQPHLYELAKLLDQYRRYAAVVADTNSARLFVFGLNTVLGQDEVQNIKTNKTQVGGWSQARYQRHVENFHQQHAKEVVEALDKLVKEEGIERIVFAGNEVIIPMLEQELPRHLSEKVVDVLRLDIRESEREVLRATLEAMREQDARDDAEVVQRMLDGYRSGGLAAAGLEGW
jgi:hypothetical protein